MMGFKAKNGQISKSYATLHKGYETVICYYFIAYCKKPQNQILNE